MAELLVGVRERKRTPSIFTLYSLAEIYRWRYSSLLACDGLSRRRQESGNAVFGVSSVEPSTLVRTFGSKIVSAAGSKRIVDVACGSGRNAIFLAQLGCSVVCIDRNLAGIKAGLQIPAAASTSVLGSLTLHRLDLVEDPWPFGPCSIGGIINVHFFLPKLFPLFEQSLATGAYLLFETVPGCGGNYLELPRAGEIKSALEESFMFEYYKEREVGPRGHRAVTVQLLARRKGNGLQIT